MELLRTTIQLWLGPQFWILADRHAHYRTSFEASRHVLALAGLKPASDASVSVNVGVAIAGYCIDLSEPGQPVVKIVGGVAEVIDAKKVE